MPGMRTIVCSKTLQPNKDSPVAIVNDAAATVAELKAKTGKDIWLFGGGNALS
jgi:dihydrofolate reductase